LFQKLRNNKIKKVDPSIGKHPDTPGSVDKKDWEEKPKGEIIKEMRARVKLIS
jgi:hypothetical protein